MANLQIEFVDVLTLIAQAASDSAMFGNDWRFVRLGTVAANWRDEICEIEVRWQSTAFRFVLAFDSNRFRATIIKLSNLDNFGRVVSDREAVVLFVADLNLAFQERFIKNSGRLLPIGTRIRFVRSLYGSATSESPPCVYAEKDTGGVVTGHGTPEGHWVKWDSWPHAFGAEYGRDFVEESQS